MSERDGAATASKWTSFDDGLTALCVIMYEVAQIACTIVVLLAIALENYDAATAFGVLVLILRPSETAARGTAPTSSDIEDGAAQP